MPKNMLIDAAHAEETRVAVVDGPRVEEFDFESRARKQLRGNIYLAKVTRVEPSLQAAFIEYGGNRHGFLAFNEIHPDYFQIPVADREALMREAASDDEDDDVGAGANGDEDDDELPAEEARLRRRLMRRYKIQEVIRRRQIMLVQVVKEERGNKGAALTTYLSLAGRYCVLMPNTPRGGGISRKITNAADRKRLKTVAQSLEVPQGIGLIIRTAGAKRTKQEIKRDYDYLLRLWESIRETTLKSIAPALIYEEENLVRRAIRDMFDKDFENVFVEGEEGFREARDFMRMLMPSQAKKIQHYREPTPLFVRFKVEDVLQQIHSPVVPLKSGGYIVINQTEALVAVDVNSGKATKERNIEATALKTNLEAADEAARQLRLRDLAGLIVIDFIDMEESKNNRAVEKRLKDALKDDRARIQLGKISGFGLLELSRQRRRTGLLEGTTHVCEHCQGTGRVRSVESSALAALRGIEMEAVRGGPGVVTLRLPAAVALYVLNEKRVFLSRLEAEQGLTVAVAIDDSLSHAEHAIDRVAVYDAIPAPAAPATARAAPIVEDDYDDEAVEDEDEIEDEEPASEDAEAHGPDGDESEAGRRRRRRRRRGRRGEERPERSLDEAEEAGEDAEQHLVARDDRDEDEDGGRRRRRRGRRGGRRAREEGGQRDPYQWVRARTPNLEEPYVWFDPVERVGSAPPVPLKAEGPTASEAAEAPVAETRPKDGRRRRARPEPKAAEVEVVAEAVAAPEPAADEAPKRRRVRRKATGGDVVAPVEAVEPAEPTPVVVAFEPEPIPEPEPAPKAVKTARAAKAKPERELELELTAPTPDPAEISTPPSQPKRGWWRRRG